MTPNPERDVFAVPQWTLAEASQRMRVPPETLQEWHRQYGLPLGQAAVDGGLDFGQRDIELLDYLDQLLMGGVPVARAAAICATLKLNPEEPGRRGAPPVGETTPLSDELLGGDDHVRFRRALTRGAESLNVGACSRVIDEVIAADGVILSWDGVIAPALREAGTTVELTGRSVQVEQTLSAAVQESFAAVLRQHRPPAPGPAAPRQPTILFACTPTEQHSLPLMAAAAALAERGIDVTLLGPRPPIDAVLDAAALTGPRVVLVWAQLRETADVGVLHDLQQVLGEATILVGGSGWEAASVTLPPGIELSHDLTDAVSRICYLVDR